MSQGRQQEAMQILQRLGEIEGMICEFKINDEEKKNGKEAAIIFAKKLLEEFSVSNLEYKSMVISYINFKINELMPNQVLDTTQLIGQ
jgi:hypothetical protein